MRNAVGTLGLHLAIGVDWRAEWRADWAWGLPLIVLTVVIHVLSLGLINQRAVRLLKHMTERRHPMLVFAQVMGTTTLLATSLHAIEAGVWAASYRFLGALPDSRSAVLYSLNAITSYGHESLFLEPHWQLMGAIEALNGCLLFGLTTAFLFAMIQKVWLLDSGGVEQDIEIPISGHQLLGGAIPSDARSQVRSAQSNNKTVPLVRS